MILGQYNDLEILRFTSVGAYLGDAEDNDVLLPQKCVEPAWQEGDTVTVFIYKDSEDRIIATTLKPYIIIDEFAYLKVNQVNFFGAFLDWGIEKDLMVPFKEQQKKLEEDERVLVYLTLDESTDRLVATTKIGKYLDNDPEHIEVNEPIEVLICEKHDLGVRVIVENKYPGLIFHNDINKRLIRGSHHTGYVYNKREDGKLDVRLELEGYDKIEPMSLDLLEIIKKKGGTLYLTDKSDPEDIREEIGMSKKTFKKAVGNLFKQKIISIDKDGITVL
jgi:predicted RNA-binding protein (virulence factor B family)